MADDMGKLNGTNIMTSTQIRKTAEGCLAADIPSTLFFAGMNCPRNEAIWRAMLILLIRQSSGNSSRISDLFPQKWLSDRTRNLYLRQMENFGMIDCVISTENRRIEMSLPPLKTAELVSILAKWDSPAEKSKRP